MIEVLNTPQMNFFSYCENNDIIHEVIAPYAPQQNRLVERKNRSLVNNINSMLYSSDLPNNL